MALLELALESLLIGMIVDECVFTSKERYEKRVACSQSHDKL